MRGKKAAGIRPVTAGVEGGLYYQHCRLQGTARTDGDTVSTIGEERILSPSDHIHRRHAA